MATVILKNYKKFYPKVFTTQHIYFVRGFLCNTIYHTYNQCLFIFNDFLLNQKENMVKARKWDDYIMSARMTNKMYKEYILL